jgi:hypothetical protein
MTDTQTVFSRPLKVAEVPSGGRHMKIKANAEECAAVAKLLHLPAIATLEAQLVVVPFGKEGVAVSGKIDAHLSQTCVATSEDFDTAVETPVSVRYSTDGVDPHAEVDLAEMLANLDAEDPPDLLVDGRIDLGAIVTEFLALALDPYPRKPGTEFSGATEEPAFSAFAALSALKKSDN